MTPDELQQQEELGRKIAAALAPLGLSAFQIVRMLQEYVDWDSKTGSSVVFRRIARKGAIEGPHYARAAGVAAYFEEQEK